MMKHEIPSIRSQEADDLQKSKVKSEVENLTLNSSECPKCVSNSEHVFNQLRIETIKQRILSELQLNERPKINSSIPREVINEALRNANLNAENNKLKTSLSSEENYGKTSKIIAFSKPGELLNNNTLIEFLLDKEKDFKLEVTKAELMVWVRLRLDQNITLQNDRRICLKRSNTSTNPDMRLLEKKKIRTITEGWQRINFTAPVKHWFSQSQSSKLTLWIQCESCDSQVNIVAFNNVSLGSHDNDERLSKNNETLMNMRNNTKKHVVTGHSPFLIIYTKSMIKHKSKREEISCNENTECCKQPLYISFEEIGWGDWIIAPKGFDANYCVGKCSSPYLMMRAQTSFLIKEEFKIKSENRLESVVACCVPTRMSSLNMLVIDYENRVVMKKFPEMIVEECGCLF
ncbi:Inhibin beta B chain-like protein [Dinothrombium tinctorium]|uniref:Inhibin beta B chain-like protein n=1 Tax=Dinothrombium tinctorium TaxID=1965070 RepID=A0A443QEL0_9ACAR|nr:Inhibin beta B chain-like protein [Dinothrombium tinctorium]